MSFKPTSSVVIRDFSGNVLGPGNSIKAGITVVPSGSGGTQLSSGVVAFGSIQIKSLTSAQGSTVSGTVWIGASPFSGSGWPLERDQSVTIPAQTLQSIRAAATVSGITIAWLAVDY